MVGRALLWRAVLLFVGTVAVLLTVTVGLLALWTVCDAASGLVGVWMIIVTFWLPFFLVPLHFKLQRPKGLVRDEPSALLALTTGLGSWLATLLIAVWMS